MQIFSFFACISFTVYLILGFYVLKTNYSSPLYRNFFYFCMAFAIWAAAVFFLSIDSNWQDNAVLVKLYYFGSLTYEIFILRFFILLTGSVKSVIKKQLVFFILWIAPGIFIYQNFVYNNIHLSFPDGFWYIGLHVLANFYNAVSIILLLIWAYKTSLNRVKRQVKIIISSAIATIVLTLIGDYIAGYLQMPSPTPILTLVWITAIFYAIIKYRMLEISPHQITLEILNSINENIILFDFNKKIKWFNTTDDNNIQGILEQIQDLNSMFKNNLQTSSLFKDFLETKEILTFRYPFTLNNKTLVYDIVIKKVNDSFGDNMGYLMKAQKVRSLNYLQKLYKITKRELDIIKLLITGLTYAEISDNLNITENTLKTHITSFYNKLGINNKVELINIINNFEKN